MAVQVDPITHKRLILVKQIYQHAVVQSASQHSTVNRIFALIEFDLAIETALKAIVVSLDSSRTPVDGFNSLAQQVNDLLDQANLDALPDLANIRHVRALRNDAQHKVRYPNEVDVNDCRTYARDFLQKVFSGIWDIDFETMSLADLVQNPEIQNKLSKAETYLEQKDYTQAVQQASAGLERALIYIAKNVVGPLSSFEEILTISVLEGDSLRNLQQIQNTVLLITLGINYANHMKYRQIAGYVTFYSSGEPYYSGTKEEISASEAEFVVVYCINTVIHIEEQVGDVEKPFGLEY